MQKFTLTIVVFFLAGLSLFAQTNFFEVVQARDVAAPAPTTVRKMGIYRLNEPAMRSYLLQAPLRFLNNGETLPLEIPLPDGTVETFGMVEAPILAPEVALLYPEIKSYAGNGLTHKSASIRLTLTSAGLHAVILGLEGDNVYFEHYAKGLRDVYFNYFTSDAIAPDQFNKPACGTGLLELPKVQSPQPKKGPGEAENNTGATLRTFRLAVAAAVEFTAAQTPPTQAQAFAAVMQYVNTMVGVYERELCVTFTLVSTNALVFTAEPDGYTGTDEAVMLGENQTKLDAVIGTAGYDVGHVLGFAGPNNSGGGIASSPSVCNDLAKARGASRTSTGFAQVFYDQLVIHEVGHQFGMSHSFNSSIPVCTTRSQPNSMEPGAGTTIMSYGYTCGADNYPAGEPFLFFHTNNYSQAVAIITGSCGANTVTTNLPPVVTMPGAFTIPRSTPFSLTGSAMDADGGLTYSWEGMNTGAMAAPDATTLANTAEAPFFRSYVPVATPTRTYPLLSAILDGTNQAVGDKLPSVGVATFHRLTVRDNRAGAGGLSFGEVTITVDGGIGPFLETTNLAAAYPGSSMQTITWSVNGTSAATPNVKISLSTDGGQTFPTTLLAATPNDGSQSVTLPNVLTTTARIKVEAVGNIFFDISNANFEIAAPLPVALVRFDVSLKGENDALLSWQTATELDNQGYDVEMATNNGTFRKMGFVKGQGTTNIASNYEFLIPNLTRGQYYFRLKMKDLNGAFEYSPIRSLVLGGAKDVVNVYPNPVLNGMLEVTLAQSDAAQLQAELINAVGQLISTTPFTNDGNIMRIELPSSGMYHLVLRLDNGTVITRKVVRL